MSAKRRKLSVSDVSEMCQKSELEDQDVQEEMTLVPILPENLLAPVPVVSVCVSTILDRTKTSHILRELKDVCPLGRLSHLKRVRKHTVKEGSKKSDEIQVILCETSKLPLIAGAPSLAHALTDVTYRHSLGTPFLANAATVPPQTRAQFDEASRHWPTAFHEDKELRSILSGKQFSVSDRDKMKHHVKRALALAGEQGKEEERGKVGALIVDPKTDTVLATTSDDPSRRSSPLHHAVMKCVDLVAHSQGGGAWSMNSDESFYHTSTSEGSGEPIDAPYLCTGYDLYISREPCIMCAMALVHSRIRRVFYLHPHPDGALGSKYKLHTTPGLNHQYQVYAVQLGSSPQLCLVPPPPT